MEPRACSLPVAAEPGGTFDAARQWELKCPMCGLKYLLLIPADARYPDQTYKDELMWRMGIDCPDHPSAVVWDAALSMPAAVRDRRPDSPPGR